MALKVDVVVPEETELMAKSVVTELGGLHILVNNAGRVWASPLLDYTPEGWDRVFDLNVRGLFFLSQRVARNMADTGGGSMIHVSSISKSASSLRR